jgi:transposase
MPKILNDRVKKVEINSGWHVGISTEMADRMKALEREHRELRQANAVPLKGEPLSAIGPRLS